jgi:hypothetical protein
MRRVRSHAKAVRTLKAHAGPFRARADRVPCAANTGDSGWRETFECRACGRVVATTEYPHGHYRAHVYIDDGPCKARESEGAA